MKPIYYHVSISSAALEIFPSWDRIENFSFPKTFHSRQSCKFCTIHHLQFDHLLICVSQHQLWLWDLVLQCGSCLCCSCRRQAKVDGDPTRHHCKLCNNCLENERAPREGNETYGCSQITCGFLASSTFVAVSEIREIYVNEFNSVNRKARSEMQSASEVVRMYFVFMRSFEPFTTTILKLESSLKVQ